MDELLKLYQVDWRIFMAGADAWLQGRNPYGALSPDLSAGAFAYPPTALPWLVLWLPLGGLGYYLWTALQLFIWWRLIRTNNALQILLLCWSPLILHIAEGQSTLLVVLVLWAASRAEKRGWLWGFALAWALTKPQAAIIPLLCLLWQDRASQSRWRLWGGIVVGTLLLALPPTLMNPYIWSDWLISLSAYRGRVLQMAPWQGASIVLFVLAAYLWYRSKRGGWQWWLTAAVFPQTSFYGMVALMPVLRPRLNNWLLLGLGLAAVLEGPMQVELNNGTTLTFLPWILCGHLLAAWMIAGGPLHRTVLRPTPSAVETQE